MKNKLLISFFIVLSTMGLTKDALALGPGGFIDELINAKPGGKAVSQTDSKDITDYLKPGACVHFYPWGVPIVKDKDTLKNLLYICKEKYISGYSPILKAPLWTMEILDTGTMKDLSIGFKSKEFITNNGLPEKMLGNLTDFKGSKYAPGQMASSENMFVNIAELSEEERKIRLSSVMQESFIVTNTVPMVESNLNNTIWKELDIFAKKLSIETSRLHIVTGPIYLNNQPKEIFGKSQIPVPTHFYKIITNSYTYGTNAYIIPNKEIFTSQTTKVRDPKDIFYCGGEQKRACSLSDFIVPVKEVERLTGMVFYPRLDTYALQKLKLDVNAKKEVF